MPPPARAAVASEGAELEIVWYPHRDAESLLPEDLDAGLVDLLMERGALLARSSRPSRWSWFG